MISMIKYIDKKFYGEYGDHWDDDFFRNYLLKRLKSDFVCLDYGAGRGKVEQVNIKGIVDRVVGVDIDDAVNVNPNIDEAKLIDLSNLRIPYEDDMFNLVFSDNVFEHVEYPEIVLREIYRVLKPGGIFIAKTPNKHHYMPIVARLTPLSFHKYYNKLRGRDRIDTFPTFYRCNSKYDVKKYASEVGFSRSTTEYWEGRPEYLRITTLTYLLGMLYERVVNMTSLFSPFRSVLVFELKK